MVSDPRAKPGAADRRDGNCISLFGRGSLTTGAELVPMERYGRYPYGEYALMCQHFSVRLADLANRLGGAFRETATRIRAEQGEALGKTQMVPQMLQANGASLMALRPHNCHQLAEGAHLPAVSPSAL